MKKISIISLFVFISGNIFADVVNLPINTHVNKVPVLVNLESNIHFGRVDLCENSKDSVLSMTETGERTVKSGCLMLKATNTVSAGSIKVTGIPNSVVYLNSSKSSERYGHVYNFVLTNGEDTFNAKVRFPNYVVLGSSGIESVGMYEAEISIPATAKAGYYRGNFSIDVLY